jgi:hypothetical protein
MKPIECIWMAILLVLAAAAIAAIGGFDDGSARVLPVTTPHGVHGKLEGE